MIVQILTFSSSQRKCPSPICPFVLTFPNVSPDCKWTIMQNSLIALSDQVTSSFCCLYFIISSYCLRPKGFFWKQQFSHTCRSFLWLSMFKFFLSHSNILLQAVLLLPIQHIFHFLVVTSLICQGFSYEDFQISSILFSIYFCSQILTSPCSFLSDCFFLPVDQELYSKYYLNCSTFSNLQGFLPIIIFSTLLDQANPKSQALHPTGKKYFASIETTFQWFSSESTPTVCFLGLSLIYPLPS